MVHFQVGQSVTVWIIQSFRDHSNKINQTLIYYNIYWLVHQKLFVRWIWRCIQFLNKCLNFLCLGFRTLQPTASVLPTFLNLGEIRIDNIFLRSLKFRTKVEIKINGSFSLEEAFIRCLGQMKEGVVRGWILSD